MTEGIKEASFWFKFGRSPSPDDHWSGRSTPYELLCITLTLYGAFVFRKGRCHTNFAPNVRQTVLLGHPQYRDAPEAVKGRRAAESMRQMADI
eukprot:6179557-Pleurochrysis_carterae.AAC.1